MLAAQIQRDQIGNGPQLLDVLDESERSPAETEPGVGVQLGADPNVREERTIWNQSIACTGTDPLPPFLSSRLCRSCARSGEREYPR